MADLQLGQRWIYDNLNPEEPLAWLGEVGCIARDRNTAVYTTGNMRILKVIAGAIPVTTEKAPVLRNAYRTYPECIFCEKTIPGYSVYFFDDIFETKDGQRLFTHLEGQDTPKW